MLQLETKTNSFDYELGGHLFKSYEKQIARSSKNVRDSFTLDSIATGFASFRHLSEIINNYTTKSKSLKLSLYQNLTNPCFLLVVCSKIKKSKIGEMHDVYHGATLLATLLSLVSALFHKKYLPKPIKRTFILKAAGKMLPFGVVSMPDSIVQQVLKFVLMPRFELVFSNSSHGCRPRRNCHSALKYINNCWRNVMWFIDCRLVQCFDTFNYSAFLSVFNRYVDDY